ncbi:MAG: hypothetical protein V1798_06300 [Pseudomonadota bacterium]
MAETRPRDVRKEFWARTKTTLFWLFVVYGVLGLLVYKVPEIRKFFVEDWNSSRRPGEFSLIALILPAVLLCYALLRCPACEKPYAMRGRFCRNCGALLLGATFLPSTIAPDLAPAPPTSLAGRDFSPQAADWLRLRRAGVRLNISLIALASSVFLSFLIILGAREVWGDSAAVAITVTFGIAWVALFIYVFWHAIVRMRLWSGVGKCPSCGRSLVSYGTRRAWRTRITQLPHHCGFCDADLAPLLEALETAERRAGL